MGFRFRKRIKIAPGISLNLSKSGISTSLGGKGFTVNIGRGKTRTTVGLPGTGISYSTTRRADEGGEQTAAAHNRLGWWLVLAVVIVLALVFAGRG
jgi:hypothetical protein